MTNLTRRGIIESVSPERYEQTVRCEDGNVMHFHGSERIKDVNVGDSVTMTYRNTSTRGWWSGVKS